MFEPKKGKIIKLKTKDRTIKVKKGISISNAVNTNALSTGVEKLTSNIANIYKENNSSNKKESSNFLKTEELLFDKRYYKHKYGKNSYPLTALIGALILGLILGAGAIVILPSIFKAKKDANSLLYGSYKDALNTLYPHTTKGGDIEDMVTKLYEVTNGNSEIKIDDDELEKMIKRVTLS